MSTSKYFAESVVYARDCVCRRNLDRHLIPDIANIVMEYLTDKCLCCQAPKCDDAVICPVTKCVYCDNVFCRDCTFSDTAMMDKQGKFDDEGINKAFVGSDDRPYKSTSCDVCVFARYQRLHVHRAIRRYAYADVLMHSPSVVRFLERMNTVNDVE